MEYFILLTLLIFKDNTKNSYWNTLYSWLTSPLRIVALRLVWIWLLTYINKTWELRLIWFVLFTYIHFKDSRDQTGMILTVHFKDMKTQTRRICAAQLHSFSRQKNSDWHVHFKNTSIYTTLIYFIYMLLVWFQITIK